ncbi:MAG: sulfatase-like hydrolase/transferase [Planctomycetota bacterium]|jgi:arylsulfatase A-like enzyme
MNRRNFLRALGAGAVAMAMPEWIKAAGPKKQRPNILYIMADDLGYADLGCYGQQKILTPNIDQMAVEGMRFTDAYAGSTVCAPSRCCLLTGMHSGHGRVRDNIPHEIWLRPDDVTVAEVLKQAGYKTGGIGKWGLGTPGSWGIANCQGFDYFYGHLSQDQAHFYYPHYLWENEKLILIGNRGNTNKTYTHDLFTEKALSFIDDNREDPFFLYLSYTIPHFSDHRGSTPERYIVPSDEPYSKKDWPQMARNYAAMITRMDKDVGRIMERIKKHGLDSNTLVIFTSDNGPLTRGPIPIGFFDSNGVFKGGKRNVYEGGIRVPFIARWPGKIKPGSTSDHVLAFWDFMPTAAELAGLDAPKGIDGISFLPTLLGKPQKQHEYLYWDYGHVRGNFMQAVRTSDWKGVRLNVNGPLELYDLKKDPGETKNVASENPKIVAQIEEIIKEAYVESPEYPIKTKTKKKAPKTPKGKK